MEAALDLRFETSLAGEFKSQSQRVKALSEAWMGKNAFCPACGMEVLRKYENNRPVADFRCAQCGEDFELKSHKSALGLKIVDGAYRTMMERLNGHRSPSLCLLQYDPKVFEVRNFLVVPSQFFLPAIIEQRPPLGPEARRAGWIGCNILIGRIPLAGRLSIVRDGVVRPSADVVADWQRASFLRDIRDFGAKGWLMAVMSCVERIGKREFTLDEVYAFEGDLRRRYPDNRNIRPKIRQQLQVLRDGGFLEFAGGGVYRLR